MPAVFVRSESSGNPIGFSVSLSMQLDLGDLVVVGGISNTTNPDDLNIGDDLGNVYHVAVQGAPGDYGTSGHAADAVIAYTIVTHPGVATIVNNSSAAHCLGVMATEYTIPAGMVLSQIGWWIGDINPAVFGGNPATDVALGTEPVDYSDSLIITLFRQGGGPQQYISQDGDTQRCWIEHSSGAQGGSGALFEAITSTPGIRNSRALITITPGGSRGGISNCLIVVFSKALPRPAGLASQAAIRPGKSGIIGTYNGQTEIVISLPYMPVTGSLVLVGCATGYSGGAAAVPAFTPADTYGNVYLPVPGGENHDAFGRLEADAMFYTIVVGLPTTGNFTVTVSMVPFPIGTGAQFPKSMTVAEYFLGTIDSLTAAVFAGNTNIGGGLMRLFTGNLTIANNTLIAGFGAARYDVGAPIPVPWNPSGGFTIDTEWGGWQVDLDALANRVRLGTGDWFHQLFSVGGTFAGETIGEFTGDTGIIVIGITFTATSPLTASCPVNGGSAVVGVPYSAQVVVSGGTPPYHFVLTQGGFPPGLTLHEDTGIIDGIPTATGSFIYELHVTDSAGHLVVVVCTIVVTTTTVGYCFRLEKVVATMKPAVHLPVRGSTR